MIFSTPLGERDRVREYIGFLSFVVNAYNKSTKKLSDPQEGGLPLWCLEEGEIITSSSTIGDFPLSWIEKSEEEDTQHDLDSDDNERPVINPHVDRGQTVSPLFL